MNDTELELTANDALLIENQNLRRQLEEAKTDRNIMAREAKKYEQQAAAYRAALEQAQKEAEVNAGLLAGAWSRLDAADEIIARGVALMPPEQLSRWSGVRAWQEGRERSRETEEQ